ncbi:ABC transporter substrate-binding protein [Rhizobium leguminosarum]|uniref:ABC transporter substrate-binding protein n=1 Tax=Rhizobium leguminosarum TaxID=384 RepID=UPI001C929DFC|nr:ABC transporter substrate-binding protein [Rhizobium leguminosarum]MBY2912523.1 ABC transporter substrate-binding protein [Rhizobium leguminosarum]MBY2968181.1 ABC transporter substrate-binding protein [Rhizobium leguminosarum]MBY2975556.1 ABC transporter substrate-binding protein [Rhizobium leguminosarum]MBY2997046.1 ABC transporter substrate-binding protein [Rhizobium leguminosarum]MBY3004106.1 ABC transporter substrate-binding protein [Rhizobium leguminosarum]
MSINRRRFNQLLLLSTVGTLLPSFAARANDQTPQSGGTLNFIVEPEPPTILALAHTAGGTQKISPKITEGLLTYDFDLTPKPQLATEWSIADDGLSYTFKLRPNVKWHDGKPFTADDVAYSVELLKQVHPRGRGTFANVTKVETPDPLTAIIRLSKPAPYLLRALYAAESPIVPKHVYENVAIADVPVNPNGSAPIGTGPFVFKEWVRGSHIILERNPNYWDTGKPHLDQIAIRFVPDGAARAAGFETGEFDIGGDNPIPLSDLERIKALPNIGVDSRGYETKGDLTQLIFNLDNEYLKDVKVRRAIAHAIDLDVILNTVWYGYGHISPTPISVFLPRYYDPSIKPYAFDLKAAEQLLDEAGYKRGADGIRFKLRLTHNSYNEGFKRVIEYLKQNLARIGIAGTIDSYDFSTYIQKVYKERVFDVTAEYLGNQFDPTLGVQRVYWSKNFKLGLPFSNASHYANPEVDRLLETASVEIDEDKRKQEFNAFQKIIADEVPVINLIALENVTVFNKRVKNHTIGAEGVQANFAEVYIKDGQG